jgi:hypothetical protein
MKRIFLFLVTNLAVLALLTLVIFIIQREFGVQLTEAASAGCRCLRRFAASAVHSFPWRCRNGPPSA